MKKKFVIKNIVFGLVILFIGASFFPSISVVSIDNTSSINNSSDTTIISNEDIEYWGLLVAVGIYADNPNENRPLMLEEVDDFHSTLLSCPWWKEDHIKVIKGEDATILNIIEGLKWLDEMEDEDDISLVYITTHGFPLGVDIPPADEADGTDEALVSFWGFAYKNLYIWDDELNFYLNRLESFGVCLIIDSCYAGGFNDPPRMNVLDRDVYSVLKTDESDSALDWMEGFAEDVSAQGRVVLMASCEDEVSYSGGFAPYLIDGLRGYGDSNDDNVVSAEEVFFYAEPRTSRQHPTMYDGFPGELPIISTDIESNSQENYYKKDIKNEFEIEEVKINKEYVSSENSTVCGYITDSNSHDPIEDAHVEIMWGDYRDGYWNDTNTNSLGFYTFNVAAGNVRLYVEAKGYMNERTSFLTVNENEVVWVNMSLDPHPEETSKICGFITNYETGLPIANVDVNIHWGHHWEGYWNATNSDSIGYYNINVAPGEIDLIFDSSDYIPKYLEEFNINEFETVWINASMTQRPPENSKICGIITDSLTHDPIENVRVYLEWRDEDRNILEYSSITDSSGYYSMNIAAGETYIEARANDYNDEYMYRNDVEENEVLWINASMHPDIIQVDLQKPLSAIYVDNERIMPYSRCIILGDIEIEAFVHDFWYRSRNDEAVKVEFYLDGVLKDTVFSFPFTYTLSERANGEHKIKVVAYDEENNSVEDEIAMLKLF